MAYAKLVSRKMKKNTLVPGKNTLWPILSAIFLVSLDQLSKALIRANFELGEYLPILGKFFGIDYTQNTGAAFGIFSDGTIFLAILAIIMTLICLGLILYPHLVPQINNRIGKISIALILAGAMGNLLDRLFLGFVTDWIYLPPIPNFNIADSCITIAVFLLLIFTFWPLILKKEEDV